MAILLKRRLGAAIVCAVWAAMSSTAGAQPASPAAPAARPAQAVDERGPQAMTPQAIQAAIDALGSVDAVNTDAAFARRMNAARALRRAQADDVAPILIHAVESSENPYVRFRALVLLTAFNDSRTPSVVKDMLTNRNDRLRTVAYGYYERHPSTEMIPALLQALSKEESEFVRPALIRALAAHGADPRVRQTLLQEVGRGQDYFRSAVIDALAD